MVTQLQNTTRNQNNLYDRDFYLWIEKTVSQLREKQFNELDLANLIEEIEDMGKQAKQSLIFPQNSPFSVDECLNPEFLPYGEF